MTTPESPSTPTSKPPQSPCTPQSRLSSDHGRKKRSRNETVQHVARALVKAAESYKEQNAQALSKKENFDGLVPLDISGVESLSIEELGDACDIAKRSVGKLKVLASSGQVFVRQVASGHTHGQAVLEVGREIGNAALPFARPPNAFVAAGTAGLYGNDFIAAPDVTVQSLGLEGGQPAGDSRFGPLFFAEVEHGNRSLPELIRYLGMLLANYPRLNGVLGIKGERDGNGNMVYALIMIECATEAGERRPHVTQLVDFGPHPYSDAKKRNVNDAVALPLPRMGEVAQSGVHGAGATGRLPEWMRFANGMNGDNPAIISISPTLLLGGAYSVGDNGAIIDIPGDALGANIDLAYLVFLFSP